MSTDRIEKSILLRVSRSRVWHAVSTAQEFAAWFGVGEIDGEFVPGASLSARITHPGYEHLTWNVTIDQVKPESFLSFRWHPYAVDPTVNYSDEPTTLVEFLLEETVEGTRLTVVESGFDSIPLARRAEAFGMNERGWSEQIKNIARYVTS